MASDVLELGLLLEGHVKLSHTDRGVVHRHNARKSVSFACESLLTQSSDLPLIRPIHCIHTRIRVNRSRQQRSETLRGSQPPNKYLTRPETLGPNMADAKPQAPPAEAPAGETKGPRSVLLRRRPKRLLPKPRRRPSRQLTRASLSPARSLRIPSSRAGSEACTMRSL